MIYNLILELQDWLTSHDLFGYVRVFTYISFRAILATVLSFSIVIFAGPRVIRWLYHQKIGDVPEFYNKTLNELTEGKGGTPTMGGILITGAIAISTLLLADLQNFYVQMAMLCLLWLAVLGGMDDWLKLTAAQRKPGSREGLYSWEKLLFQVGLAALLGLFVWRHGDGFADTVLDSERVEDLRRMSRSLTLPFLKSWEAGLRPGEFKVAEGLIDLPLWAFVILTLIVITGSSNAVNLTDGMDGLASGIMTIVAFAFLVLTFIAGYGNGSIAKFLLVPWIPGSDELSVVCGAMVGSCLGFLWWNCSPAKVFMGDTGSLPLGGLIGFIAVVIRQEFLLLIIGGIFVLEAVSVILQVGYFKATGGKRIFRCAPIHHHFHLMGVKEQQVVVRFWVVSVLLVAIALATIKLR